MPSRFSCFSYRRDDYHLENDIAVIRLPTSIEKHRIIPLCDRSYKYSRNYFITAVGMGISVLYPKKKHATVLQETYLQAMTNFLSLNF